MDDSLVTYKGWVGRISQFGTDLVSLDDIAHNLSRLCRFSGGTSRFYSVAEHCIYCRDIFRWWRDSPFSGEELEWNTVRLELLLLLHDAAEAYISDIPAYVKAAAPELLAIEAKVRKAIFEYFHIGDLTEEEHKIISKCDSLALLAEARCLCSVELYNYLTGQAGYKDLIWQARLVPPLPKIGEMKDVEVYYKDEVLRLLEELRDD